MSRAGWHNGAALHQLLEWPRYTEAWEKKGNADGPRLMGLPGHGMNVQALPAGNFAARGGETSGA